MRRIILGLAPGLGLKINTNVAIEPTMLLQSDEIFLSNAIVGIRWVMGYKERRYFNTTSKKLLTAINAATFTG